MKKEIIKKLSQLEASSADLSKNRETIIRKWSKRMENDTCLNEQEITPFKTAFLYLLLDNYENLFKNNVAEFLNENVKKEIPEWESIEQFDAATDVYINSLELENLENSEWEIMYGNKYDYAIFHVYFNAWKPEFVGFIF